MKFIRDWFELFRFAHSVPRWGGVYRVIRVHDPNGARFGLADQKGEGEEIEFDANYLYIIQQFNGRCWSNTNFNKFKNAKRAIEKADELYADLVAQKKLSEIQVVAE